MALDYPLFFPDPGELKFHPPRTLQKADSIPDPEGPGSSIENRGEGERVILTQV